MERLIAGRLPADDLAANLSERLEPLSRDQAIVEASRCLYCFDAPCMVACPTSIDIPSFINRIATGDTMGSAEQIFDANVLGASCARVCATEELCEEACVLDRAHEKPIQIGQLQRFATDAFMAAGRDIPYEAGPDTGLRVAVVGGGPAGLAAAAGLRQRGHAVTIFERQPQLGGLATYGIIPLREPTEIALWEAQQVLNLGVEARTGVEVGVDVGVDDVLAYDAVFLSTGAGRNVMPIGLEGDSAPGVADALEFIESCRTTPPQQIPVGQRVVVIGAGNTAMDACILAVRLGAPVVQCVYRRTAAEMTGYPNEFEHCKSEGVLFQWLTQPLRVVTGDDGAVTGLECARVELSDPGPDGRPRPVLSEDRFVIEADHVLLATGQNRETDLARLMGLDIANYRPVTGEDFATTNPKVFAGGDHVLSGKELSVVDAVAQGRDAAVCIDRFLTGGNNNG